MKPNHACYDLIVTLLTGVIVATLVNGTHESGFAKEEPTHRYPKYKLGFKDIKRFII